MKIWGCFVVLFRKRWIILLATCLHRHFKNIFSKCYLKFISTIFSQLTDAFILLKSILTQFNSLLLLWKSCQRFSTKQVFFITWKRLSVVCSRNVAIHIENDCIVGHTITYLPVSFFSTAYRCKAARPFHCTWKPSWLCLAAYPQPYNRKKSL